MMLQVYTLHDRVADTYLAPFYAANDADAQRMMRRELYNGQSQLSMFSADYALLLIGAFDDKTGTIRPREEPKSLGLLSALMPQKAGDSDV